MSPVERSTGLEDWRCNRVVGFGAQDEEGPRSVQFAKAREIQIGAVHDIDRPGLGAQQVENVDIVPFPFGDMDKGWDFPLDIEQGMQFDGGLRLPEVRPAIQIQAEVDDRGIQGIDGRESLQTRGLADPQPLRRLDQALTKVLVNPPVADPVGIG